MQIYRSGFRTKGEAEAAKAMNQILAEIDSGDYFEPSMYLIFHFILYGIRMRQSL
ncbi:hypothetical protein ACFFIS_09645 [Virgibacillus soli]|uniref:hypothetical protein n=1 Tax=Paracerasibacillus soli TaxID=480284 RepID=UPI0035E822B0